MKLDSGYFILKPLSPTLNYWYLSLYWRQIVYVYFISGCLLIHTSRAQLDTWLCNHAQVIKSRKTVFQLVRSHRKYLQILFQAQCPQHWYEFVYESLKMIKQIHHIYHPMKNIHTNTNRTKQWTAGGEHWFKCNP